MSIFRRKKQYPCATEGHTPPYPYHFSEVDRELLRHDQEKLDALSKLLGVAYSYDANRYRIEAHFIDKSKEPEKK
jgi:hypothetical protein